MSGAAVPVREPLSAPVARPSRVRVGTVVWLSSELMFFAGLFATYFTLRAATSPWPPPGVDLGVARAGLFTLVLVASSGSMQYAVLAAERADVRAVRRWLLVTIALGVVFLGNQALEWRANNFTISSSGYGSAYYLMTGFHGLHVIGGLLAMLVLLLRSAYDRMAEPQESAIAVVGYYWHFVDVVWIGLFVTLFLIR